MTILTVEKVLAGLADKSLQEGPSLEFKREWTKKSGRTLAAMANAKGGWLLVGVDDHGHTLESPKEELVDQKQRIESHISEHLHPHSAVQSINIHKVNKHLCLLIEVVHPKSITSWNKTYYKRVGSQTRPMSKGEVEELKIKSPGLDFSALEYKGPIDSALVLDFAQLLPSDNGHWTQLKPQEILQKLGIYKTNTSGILFGNFTYRVAHYAANGEPLDQNEGQGLYGLLKNNFIPHVQAWSRKQPMQLKKGTLIMEEEQPYAEVALRELLVNAVAHSAHEQSRHEMIVRLHPNRIEISNHCVEKNTYFVINKVFSTHYYLYNPLLMKTLRKAKISESLGPGKSKVFKSIIESGKRPPLFSYNKMPNDYGMLSVTLYNEQPNQNFLTLLTQLKQKYHDQQDKYKIASALVLWKDKALCHTLSHMDEYHQNLTKQILQENDSPFVWWVDNTHQQPEIRIYFKRWVEHILFNTNNLSLVQRQSFKKFLCHRAYTISPQGYIDSKQARQLLGFSDQRPEIARLSRLFSTWQRDGFCQQTPQRGVWQILQRPQLGALYLKLDLESLVTLMPTS